MLYVSILIELLRSRPAVAVLLAAFAQAVVWTLVPSLLYTGPPGELPLVLAIGHEFQLGSYLGPPLAFWLPLAVEVGLLLMTSYIGTILLALVVLFTVANKRARGSLKSYDPLITAIVAVLLALPHVIWLSHSPGGLWHVPPGLRTSAAIGGSFGQWIRQLAFIFAAHAGLLVLVGLVGGWPWPRRDPAPVIVRAPIDGFARQFIYFFALVPAFAGTLL